MKRMCIINVLLVLLVAGCLEKQVKTTIAQGQDYTYESPFDPAELRTWLSTGYPFQLVHSTFGEGWVFTMKNPDPNAEYTKGGMFIRNADLEKGDKDHPAFISDICIISADGLLIEFYEFDPEKNCYCFDEKNSEDNRTKL